MERTIADVTDRLPTTMPPLKHRMILPSRRYFEAWVQPCRPMSARPAATPAFIAMNPQRRGAGDLEGRGANPMEGHPAPSIHRRDLMDPPSKDES